MAESGRPESASPRMMGLLLFALVLLGCSAGSSACCSTWTAFPKVRHFSRLQRCLSDRTHGSLLPLPPAAGAQTNNVYGQVTGSCKEAGKQPTVADPCFAGLQAAHQATVTATTYVEFGPVESLELCEAAASASPLQPPCVSVTWHSPECAGCGPAWMKHCYCMTDSTWLKDPGNPLAGSADQVGVVSAKCTEPGCGGGWTVVALLLGGAGLYLGGGAAYRSKTMGAKGRQMIPHLHFWEELEGLVHDGAAFARCVRDTPAAAGSAFLLPSL
jgi:hypothetical protein